MQVQNDLQEYSWIGLEDSDLFRSVSFLFSGEFGGSTIVVLVSAVATKIFENNFCFNIFTAAACYLATRVAKKLFTDYTGFTFIEKQAILVTRKMPSLKYTASGLALLFAKHLPYFSFFWAVTAGVIAGFTYGVETQVKTLKVQTVKG